MRAWALVLLALAAVAVLATWRIRVFVAGGKAMLALAVIGVVAWLLLRPADERR